VSAAHPAISLDLDEVGTLLLPASANDHRPPSCGWPATRLERTGFFRYQHDVPELSGRIAAWAPAARRGSIEG
jgi:hypothetical protein